MLARARQENLARARRAFRALPKELKNELRRAQRAQVGPIWKEEIERKAQRAPDLPQRLVLTAGVRVQAGLPMSLIAGSGRKKLSGGGTPRELTKPLEFGSKRQANYTRYRRGGHPIERRTSRQLPAARRSGYVVYPALAETIPRLSKLWVTATAQRIYDAAEGR